MRKGSCSVNTNNTAVSSSQRLMMFLVVLLMMSLIVTVTAQEQEHNDECICKMSPKPNIWKKEETARWMAHTLNWGILSSISSRLVMKNDETKDFIHTNDEHAPTTTSTTNAQTTTLPVPFGNVYSFVDGTCNNSTGIPYIYGTYLDQSFIDTIHNNAVSFTLSENTIPSVCFSAGKEKSCTVAPGTYGDPESPVCARLVLSGTLQVVNDDVDNDEYNFALKALYQRHPSMADWPTGHKWIIGKINIKEIWLIDYFGGATIIDINKYYNANVKNTPATTEKETTTETEEKHVRL